MRAMRASCLIGGLLLAGCGLSTQVRPTPKGVLVGEASVGGPAVLLGGAPVPLPLSTVGVSWGFTDKSDLSTHMHLTTLLAQRIAGFDVGGSWLFVEPSGLRPALCFGWRGYVFTDFSSAALGFFDTAVTASWNLSRRFVPFVTVAAQLSSLGLAVDFSPAVGVQIRFARFSLQAEVRWFAPNQNARGAAAEWLSPYKRGAHAQRLSEQPAAAHVEPRDPLGQQRREVHVRR